MTELKKIMHVEDDPSIQMVKDGEAVKFINLTGLFPGETKDGRAMFKGKPKETLFLRLEDGHEVAIDGFLVTAKEKR